MARRRIEIEIVGDAGSLQRAFGQAGQASDGFSGKMKAAGKVAAGVFAGGLVVGIAGMKASVDAAKDAEASQVKVETMLKNAGISWAKHGEQIDATIQKHSALTGFDDEELAESFANMVRTTGDVNKALEMNALTADVARTKGIDLAAAQSMLAKVYNGNYAGLKKLGIATDDIGSRQEALAALQKHFGGQAAAYGKTAAGAQDRFKVAVENLQEMLGAYLLPIVTKVTEAVVGFVLELQNGEGTGGKFIAVGKSIVAAFEGMYEWGGRNKTLLTDIGIVLGIATAAFLAYKIGLIAASIATGAVTLANAALNAVMLANPIVLVVAALVALGAGLVLAYRHSETFRDIVDGAFSVVKVAAGVLWDVAKVVFGGIVTVVKAAWSVISVQTKLVWDAIKGTLGVAFDALKILFTTWFDTYKTVIGAAWDVISGVTKVAWALIKTFIVGPIGEAVSIAKSALGNDGLLGWVKDNWETFEKAAKRLAAPFVTAFEGIGTEVKKVLDFLGDIIGKVKDVISWIGKINPTKIKLPDLNPFGGAGNGTTVGPTMGPDAFKALSLSMGLSGGTGQGQAFRPGDPGWHGQNRARDHSGPPGAMLAFAKHLLGFAPKLLELIYTPLGVGVKNGRVVPMSFFGADVAANHFDHVHVAMAHGGVVRARVGEMGPEDVYLPHGSRVVPNHETRSGGGAVVTIENYHANGRRDAEILANRLAFRVAFG